MARQIVCRCRSPPSSPSHATFVAYNRSSLRSKQPPPSAMHGRLRVPEPSVPHGSELPERTCSLSCLSWLHLLKSWSLRQSRGGSVIALVGFSWTVHSASGAFWRLETRIDTLEKQV